MNMNKPITRLAFTLLMLLTLVALPQATHAQDKVTITYWDWWVTQGPAMDAAIKDFMAAHPNITVEKRTIGGGPYNDTINLAFQGDSAPDVFLVEDTNNFKSYIANGWVLPLNTFSDFSQWKATFPDPAANFTEGINVLGGKTYSAPLFVAGSWLQLYVNTKLYKDAGLVNADGSIKLPKTVDDMIANSQVIKDKSAGKAYGFGWSGTQTWALLLALVLNNAKMRFRTFYRTVYFLPVVTSLAIGAIAVRLMLGRGGAQISELFGIDPPISPIASPQFALPSVILFGIWHSFGINLVYFLAALQTVPEELYDAAKVDGANGNQRLLYITLPTIRPLATIIVFFAILGSLQVFEQSFVLTGGGPFFASEVVSGYIYSYAFGGSAVGRSVSSVNIGYASATSLFMSLVVLGITIIQAVVLRRTRKA